MKKNPKRTGKGSISQMVFGLIAKNHLDKESGKDSMLKVVGAIKRKYPRSKFKDTHYYWYLSKFRKQKDQGLDLDKLHSKINKKRKKK